MKKVCLFLFFSICMFCVNNPVAISRGSVQLLTFNANHNDGNVNGSQDETGGSTMPAAVFKSQDFCRAEVKDFEFEVAFKVVSATVYFTGTNFINPVKGTITSSSLRSIKDLMKRCVPGTIVMFDEVKVIGPDNKVRSIQGLSIRLI